MSKIKTIIEEEKKDELVGYTGQGERLTVAEMNEKLAKSETSYHVI